MRNEYDFTTFVLIYCKRGYPNLNLRKQTCIVHTHVIFIVHTDQTLIQSLSLSMWAVTIYSGTLLILRLVAQLQYQLNYFRTNSPTIFLSCLKIHKTTCYFLSHFAVRVFNISYNYAAPVLSGFWRMMRTRPMEEKIGFHETQFLDKSGQGNKLQ